MDGMQQATETPGAGYPAETAPPTRGAPEAARPPGWVADRREAFDPGKKSPVLAFFLSIIPGMGQIYIGYYVRGFVHAAVVVACIFFLSVGIPAEFEPIFGLLIPFVVIYNMIDAGRRAALYNRAVHGIESIEMPQDFKMPSMGGSIVGGTLLLTVGVIALSNTLFGYPLTWLRDWWPVALLAFGVYLVVRGVLDRGRATEPVGSREP